MRSPRVRREPPAGLRGAAARALRGPAAALFTAFVLLFAQSEGQARQAATALGGLRVLQGLLRQLRARLRGGGPVGIG